MKHENKEVREQPQWVVDILNRLDRLEDRMTLVINLHADVEYLLREDGINE